MGCKRESLFSFSHHFDSILELMAETQQPSVVMMTSKDQANVSFTGKALDIFENQVHQNNTSESLGLCTKLHWWIETDSRKCFDI